MPAVVQHHHLLDGQLMTLITFQGDSVLFKGDKVGSEQACCCGDGGCDCPADCDPLELSVTLTYCNMTAQVVVPVPGSGNMQVNNGDDFLIVEASITCLPTPPCGWAVDVLVCYRCNEMMNGEGFFAVVPQQANGCPDTGAVDLTCFGDQFGIPCATNPTASIG